MSERLCRNRKVVQCHQRLWLHGSAIVERMCSSTSLRSSLTATVSWKPTRRWSFPLRTGLKGLQAANVVPIS